MKRNHRSYNNLKNWKEEEKEGSYEIVPAPNGSFLQLMITIPVAGVFYWLLHHKLDITNKTGLLMMDFIIVSTSILMILIFLYNRNKTKKDSRPHLLFSASTGELLFPRHDKAYKLMDSQDFFISHDCFYEGGEHAYSELNLIEPLENGEKCFPLLHHLGRYREFDRIGKKLNTLGVPFAFREGNQESEQDAPSNR
jgi:hypothetical protein